MTNPYPFLKTMGPPVPYEATHPEYAASQVANNDPMRVNFGNPLPATVTPKWQQSLASAAGSIGNALTAPGNALAGNYNQLTVGPDGSVSPMDPRMVQDASNLAGMVTLGAGAMPAEAGALRMGMTGPVKDLSSTVTHLYRETSPSGVNQILEKQLSLGQGSAEGTQIHLYWSDNPDLALGQGTNKGVIVKMSTGGVRGAPDVSKPGASVANGTEYVTTDGVHPDNIQSITLTQPLAKNDPSAIRLSGKLSRMVNSGQWGWVKNPDKTFTLNRLPPTNPLLGQIDS